MCRATTQAAGGPTGAMCPLHSVMSGGCPRVPIPVSEQMVDTYTDIDTELGTVGSGHPAGVVTGLADILHFTDLMGFG